LPSATSQKAHQLLFPTVFNDVNFHRSFSFQLPAFIPLLAKVFMPVKTLRGKISVNPSADHFFSGRKGEAIKPIFQISHRFSYGLTE